jgi:hypothetical protein
VLLGIHILSECWLPPHSKTLILVQQAQEGSLAMRPQKMPCDQECLNVTRSEVPGHVAAGFLKLNFLNIFVGSSLSYNSKINKILLILSVNSSFFHILETTLDVDRVIDCRYPPLALSTSDGPACCSDSLPVDSRILSLPLRCVGTARPEVDAIHP